MKTLGSRLKNLRERKGLSASQVAGELGIALSTYKEWEYGRQIRGEPYRKLAEVLGVSLSEILLGKPVENQTIEASLKRIEDAIQAIRSTL